VELLVGLQSQDAVAVLVELGMSVLLGRSRRNARRRTTGWSRNREYEWRSVGRRTSRLVHNELLLFRDNADLPRNRSKMVHIVVVARANHLDHAFTRTRQLDDVKLIVAPLVDLCQILPLVWGELSDDFLIIAGKNGTKRRVVANIGREPVSFPLETFADFRQIRPRRLDGGRLLVDKEIR